MFWLFDHRYGTYDGQTEKQANKGVLPRVSDDEHSDPCFGIDFRYWIDSVEVDHSLAARSHRHRWMLALRDVTITERTLIATALPTAAFNHKAPVLLCGRDDAKLYVFLLANLSSFVVDYCVRQKTGGGLGLYVLKQAPVLQPDEAAAFVPWLGSSLQDFVVPRAFELSYTSWHLRGMAEDLGEAHPPFVWTRVRRMHIRSELDALFFHVYGLSRFDTETILDSFDVLCRYEERPAESGGFGEYLSKRLILERYDAMAEAEASGREYESILDPPPADPSLCHPESTRPDWAKRRD